ncbi:FAD-dependent oxidoreductase [Niallia sp. XMNu-256]|uniref:glycerol-3-phosphate dehydrogenase/oxidase n=1 Tax=Niallia sp. XMNu-256 TaxID=3082444 RepID=UPI0030CB6101
MNFSNRHRNHFIEQLTSQTFDVLVIGGGITGAGIALDGTLRGMKIALIDMQDFSAGTSSRSTKLIHGGLRYLKQWEFRLVSEVGKEREVVYNIGPHVTTPEKMLLPIYKHGTLRRCTTSIGLKVYDYLASVKKSERRKMLSREECIEKEPLLKRRGLIGGGYYVEYRTDDARLTIEVIKSAYHYGALCLNYIKAESLQYNESGEINGVTVTDIITGKSHSVRARKVVNATGPWVDTICEKDGSLKGKNLRRTKGIHLVFDKRDFPLKQAIYFDTYDGRMVFAIPRQGKTYVGTTDTFFEEDPISPKVTREDRGYLLKCINSRFPSLRLTDKNIESSWAGVRPLILDEGKNPSEISRKDEIWESETGLITIAGGKLTGYRKMAELVLDLISNRFEDRLFRPCKTAQTPISGGYVEGGSARFQAYVSRKAVEGVKYGLTLDEAKELVSFYGSNVDIVFEYLKKNKQEQSIPLSLFVKLNYALDHEMVLTPLDFFIRRTGILYFEISLVKKYSTDVILYMSKYFNWNEEQIKNNTEELKRVIEEAERTILLF